MARIVERQRLRPARRVGGRRSGELLLTGPIPRSLGCRSCRGLAIGRLDLVAAACAGGWSRRGNGGRGPPCRGWRSAGWGLTNGWLPPRPDTVSFGIDGFNQLYAEGMGGTVPATDWAWLLVTAPHSGTFMDVYGAGGVAIALLGLCLIVTDALGRARWLVYPLIAVGSLSLTTYVGHILLIWLDENDMLDGTPRSFLSEWLSCRFCWARIFATLWHRLVKRAAR